MLVLRPDTPDEQVQSIIDKSTRSVISAEGQIIKVSPWGRRRLAYPIGQFREGSYFIVMFEAPSAAVLELERGLNITEEVMRHLITRIERPLKSRALTGDEAELDEDAIPAPPSEDDEEIPDTEFIDESESEAAPAAIDR
jgi:small subunit ribosomal protein S6